MKVSDDKEMSDEKVDTARDAKDTGRSTKSKNSVNSDKQRDMQTRSDMLTGREEKGKCVDRSAQRLYETPRTQEGRRARRLKKLRKIYQAELVKNMKFFQSARPHVELGTKPLSVQHGHGSDDNGYKGQGDAMEQLD